MLSSVYPLSKNKISLLEEIFKNDEISGSQIAKNLNLLQPLVHRTLKELLPILNKKRINNLILYSIKEEYIKILEPLIENNRFESTFSNKLEFLKLMVKKFSIINIYIFGSYAKNTNTETSDIDLIIISDDCKDEIKKTINNYKLKLNLNIELIIFNSEQLKKIKKDKTSNFNSIINERNERIKVIF